MQAAAHWEYILARRMIIVESHQVLSLKDDDLPV